MSMIMSLYPDSFIVLMSVMNNKLFVAEQLIICGPLSLGTYRYLSSGMWWKLFVAEQLPNMDLLFCDPSYPGQKPTRHK